MTSYQTRYQNAAICPEVRSYIRALVAHSDSKHLYGASTKCVSVWGKINTKKYIRCEIQFKRSRMVGNNMLREGGEWKLPFGDVFNIWRNNSHPFTLPSLTRLRSVHRNQPIIGLKVNKWPASSIICKQRGAATGLPIPAQISHQPLGGLCKNPEY